MAIASASRVRVAYTSEAVIGTTPAAPTYATMRRTTGNLTSRKTTVVSDEIQSDRNVRDELMTGLDPQGTIGFELSYGTFDALIAAAVYGTWVNNVLTNGIVEQSFTWEETTDIGGGNFSYSRFKGVEVNTFALAVNSRQSVKGTFGLMGQQETLDSAIVTGATYTAPNTNTIMTANQVGALTLGGTAAKVKNLSLNVANNLRIRDEVGTLYTDGFGLGSVDVTGSVDCYFTDNTLYQQVLNHGSAQLLATLGATSGSKYTLNLPIVRFLDGARTLAGKNDDVMVNIPFRSIFDPVTNSSFQLTRAVA